MAWTVNIVGCWVERRSNALAVHFFLDLLTNNCVSLIIRFVVVPIYLFHFSPVVGCTNCRNMLETSIAILLCTR
jgi:hypothetical protein